MITAGLILMLIGVFIGVPVLWSLGTTLLIIGVVLFVLGSLGRSVGGRRHYY